MPLPVIVVTCVTYIALFAALLVVHLSVPHYPASTPAGINLTQGWLDLETITQRYHPYNSHANDDVRKYLLSRVQDIVASKNLGSDRVYIIDDNVSNVTFSSSSTTVYFEGTNLIVAIRGSEDKESSWPSSQLPLNSPRTINNGGVLVNAHYDSVSTGFGATDDGVGVVSVLQLLSYFTDSHNWPKRTVVLLMNNGEEDFLNGAKAFMRHPISQVPHTFLNLEGAGAGGRATLFRSTDTEVTRFYQKSSHPFGTVISSDGFKKKLIRSETDYVVFNGELGLRGLDVAFMEPRARYHTFQDSARETSMNSLWHMLSASIATVSGLASDMSSTFSGSGKPRDDGKVDAGSGTDAVWFDLFGKAFVIFRLHTMFAFSVTLLVVAPVTLILLTVALSKADKNYLFARKKYIHSSDDDQAIELNGWRGFFRFPIVFVVATAVVVALAYLVARVNPYVVYSSPFSVWSMMLSAWVVFAWFFLRGASVMRPSALQRMYSLIWLFIGAFALLILVTIMAQNYQVAGGYFIMFYFAGIFFALLISYIELFFVPSKTTYVGRFDSDGNTRRNSESVGSRPLTGTTGGARSEDRPILDDDATETTSLLRGDRQSFARYGSRRQSTSEGTDHEERRGLLDLGKPFPGEQEWSGKLPSWLWIIQFLLLIPFVIILVGQVSLLMTSALYQTPADGSSTLFIYIGFAALATLLVAPNGPFIHRFTYHIPTFLFLVCVGTLIYNLVAFPFSRDHRLKVYFVQQVDCDSGVNTVSLTGLDEYVQSIVREIPSAQGQPMNCTTPDIATRKELKKCAWNGLPAQVVPRQDAPFSNKTYHDTWLDYSIVKGKNPNEATIRVVGLNTRACRVFFDSPIVDLVVEGGVSDPRFNATGDTGSRELRLWHRNWSQPWNISVKWDGDANSTLSGRVVCLWSDANTGAIPAYDEVLHYMPVWSIATKLGDGLVEGSKRFKV
ncbi:endoplasmic reticulum metallopeptidase 1 [Lindgomyces ingoldianus]|uniref:Endoplasmic reticulum metallopeptidase 1 n=1 Tax=Lindgomyces ingoldianus TaxID=673940 RepID=A0ACB6QCD5_9PLEO|nr:endoplasmic reticulum metallopeptidase 1 [Lindgomyces ingoldianus]KAF2464598.1 endoplasmic reticulum metallopeptidase 1 [Lindgomyces ingoldianus]